jgi:hypothetical protein
VQRRFDPHQYWLDPEDPRNVLHSSGEAGGLERYLERVAATDPLGHSPRPPS